MARKLALALALVAGCSHNVRTTVPLQDGPPGSSASSCMALPDPTDCLRRSPGARVEPSRTCPATPGHLCVERREPDHAKTGVAVVLIGTTLLIAAAIALEFQDDLYHSGD